MSIIWRIQKVFSYHVVIRDREVRERVEGADMKCVHVQREPCGLVNVQTNLKQGKQDWLRPV